MNFFFHYSTGLKDLVMLLRFSYFIVCFKSLRNVMNYLLLINLSGAVLTRPVAMDQRWLAGRPVACVTCVPPEATSQGYVISNVLMPSFKDCFELHKA